MKTLKIAAIAAALAGSALATTPTWAKTAFQYWAQGEGVYVSSKDHPPGGISDFFFDAAGQPVPPPGYYDPYGQPLPPAYPYGPPAY